MKIVENNNGRVRAYSTNGKHCYVRDKNVIRKYFLRPGDMPNLISEMAFPSIADAKRITFL